MAPKEEDEMLAIITWIQDKNVAPRMDLTPGRKRELLAGWVEDDMLDVKDRIKAMEQHSKMVGDHAAQKVEHHGNIQHQIESMSDEDLEKEMKKLGMMGSLDFVDTQCSYLPDVDSVALKPTIIDAEELIDVDELMS